MIFEPIVDKVTEIIFDEKTMPYPIERVISEKTTWPLKEMAEYSSYLSAKNRETKRKTTYRDLSSEIKGVSY